MPKVVIDTSVFVAGLLSKSAASSSAQILARWHRGRFTLVMAPQLLNELVGILLRKGLPEDDVKALVRAICKLALNIPGAYEATKLAHIDPGDNKFLAAAYEAKADYLVSLDKKHLLSLKHYHGTQIVSPDAFIKATADD